MVKISFYVSDEVYDRLRLIPHGMRRYVYQTVFEGFSRYLVEHTDRFVQDILEHRLNIEAIEKEAFQIPPPQEDADGPTE